MEALPSAVSPLFSMHFMITFISFTEVATRFKAVEECFRAKQVQIQAESIGWIPMDEGSLPVADGSDTIKLS
jgi:hypothetical protein